MNGAMSTPTPRADHCWHRSSYQHSVPNHCDEVCCHCGAGRCTNFVMDRDPAHGPHVRVEVVVKTVSKDVGPCVPTAAANPAHVVEEA